MGDLRSSGLYDGGLLDMLIEATQTGRVPVRGGMGSYMLSGRGEGSEGERMWRDEYYFIAGGVARLP